MGFRGSRVQIPPSRLQAASELLAAFRQAAGLSSCSPPTRQPPAPLDRLPECTAGRSWLRSRDAGILPGCTSRGTEAIPVRRRVSMLWTIFVVLLIMWLLGMVTSYTLGGFIHVLLLIALAVVLIRIIQGRRPVV